jgi:nucleoside phosphorylase
VKVAVPQGAEARAVLRTVPSAIVLPPGAAAASALPELRGGETVVVVGLCGALWRAAAGDVVIYGRVADAAHAFAFEPELVDALARALPGAHVVNACTTRRVVTTVAARHVLAQRFNADVVDMEGTHLAAAFRARGVRAAMVRVVSDDASRDLPPIEDAIDAEGRLRPLRIASAFVRSPRAALAFVRDVRGALAKLAETAGAITRSGA